MNRTINGLHSVGPMLLILGTVASIVLWMPFGVGYYGWPWQHVGWRIALYFFVFAFPVGAIHGCIAAFRGGFSIWRFGISLIAFLVGSFGAFAMLDWFSRYVGPMLRGAYPHP